MLLIGRAMNPTASSGLLWSNEPKEMRQMASELYPQASRALVDERNALAPEISEAFQAFQKKVFADGALPARTKQLIAVAVAHVTQCPYCIKGHTRSALRAGATEQEIMEAIWVAAEMRAGGAFAHSAIALATLEGSGAEGESKA